MRCSATCLTGLRCKRNVKFGDSCWTHSPKEMSECTICLENMNNKEVYKMNCNHIFDKKCFLEYVNNCENKKITCPNCRSYII